MAGSSWRTIVATRDGECRLCGGEVKAGTKVRWHPSKGIEHERGDHTAEIKPEYAESTAEREAKLTKQAPADQAEKPKREKLPSGETLMESQFSGSACRVCTKPIVKGAQIAWIKGKGARHIECEPTEAAA